jgi:hypothetical protein
LGSSGGRCRSSSGCSGDDGSRAGSGSGRRRSRRRHSRHRRGCKLGGQCSLSGGGCGWDRDQCGYWQLRRRRWSGLWGNRGPTQCTGCSSTTGASANCSTSSGSSGGCLGGMHRSSLGLTLERCNRGPARCDTTSRGGHRRHHRRQGWCSCCWCYGRGSRGGSCNHQCPWCRWLAGGSRPGRGCWARGCGTGRAWCWGRRRRNSRG